MTQPQTEPFVALALRWDLRQLHHDLTAALGMIEGVRQPYVPTQLATALHMFLDSYDRAGAPDSRP